jgi:putative ABC transport system substrate-binding protein
MSRVRTLSCIVLPMFATHLRTLLRALRVGVGVGVGVASVGAALLGGGAHAGGLTVLIADETAPHTEFLRQLQETRDLRDPIGRFDVVRMSNVGADVSTASVAPTATTEEERSVVAGVRTRGLRASAATSAVAADKGLTMAVGLTAARAAIERPGQQPLLLVMLTRLDYESLKTSIAFKRADRRVGVLLRDPAMADQLALVDAVLPGKRRLGVVATAESEPLLRELQRAAQGWDLQVEYAPDAKSLGAALRAVLPRNDALMVLPDLIGESQAATLAVLHAGASAGLPVFGASEGLVRSGGLAAAVSTPSQLAMQARAMGLKLASSGAGSAGSTGGGNGTGADAPGVLVEAATPATVRVNSTVARGLNLRVPDERELTDRLTAVR